MENKRIENKQNIDENSNFYTLNCPTDLFRYFLRKLYRDVEISNEECDELGEDFYKYLKELNLTKKQRENILPKDTFDVIINSDNPFRTNGFPAPYVLHFTQYVKQKKEQILSEDNN